MFDDCREARISISAESINSIVSGSLRSEYALFQAAVEEIDADRVYSTGGGRCCG